MSDQKVSQLTAKTSLAATDQLYTIDPISKRLTVLDLMKNIGPNNLLTVPVDSQFSWVNQGTSTVSQTDAGIALVPQLVTGINIRIREKVPNFAPPYTVTVGMMMLAFNAATDVVMGAGWRNSGAGTLAVLQVQLHTTYATCALRSRKYNSPTAVNSDYVAPGYIYGGGPIWIRFADTGVNRVISMSMDGVNFGSFHSIGRTDFLTPDRICFYGNVDSA